MSDFKKIADFRKGKKSKNDYQDPTYMSFLMLFDFADAANSPLLSKPAEDFLAKLANGSPYYTEKLEALQNFKKALKHINNEMPWFWQSLSGLERLQQYNPMNAYFGGDDAKLVITTLESINLTISGLMHLYRVAVFDERKWTYVLPCNLRKFRMYVYVTEVRSIKNMTNPKVSGVDLDGFPDNFKPSIGVENSNAGISGSSARPYFMFALKFCEFDLTSGTSIFADLQKSPTDAATGEITINYEGLYDIESRVLNGIVESRFNKDDLSPAPDTENKQIDGIGDYLKDQAVKKGMAFADRAVTDLKNTSINRVNELKQQARNATVGRLNVGVNNLYKDFVQGVDSATNPVANQNSVQTAIADNVHGITSGGNQTIGDALNSAAAKSLGNIHD
jgi:hypothetical protein